MRTVYYTCSVHENNYLLFGDQFKSELGVLEIVTFDDLVAKVVHIVL